MSSESLMTLPEVAKMLKVRPDTVRRWIESGRNPFPCYRLSGNSPYRFKKEEVEASLVKVEVGNGRN